MEAYLKLLKKSSKVALFSHANPDPDTIGSTLALKLVLEKLGKVVDLFCGDPVPQSYLFLEEAGEYNSKQYDENNYDLIVAVDLASPEMMGQWRDQILSAQNSLRIDHHISGTNYAKVNVMVPYSACAILIYEIAKKLHVKIDDKIATRLYFGICGDTGIFKNNNTDSKTFEVAADLFKAGANARKVYEEFFEVKTVPYVQMAANCTLKAELNDEYKYALMTATYEDYQKYNLFDTDLGNLPHTYLNCGYKIGVILKEKEKGEIHCSFRSKFDYNVAEIAEQFGGGGHKNASGCTIMSDITHAKKLIKSAIEKYLSNGGEINENRH
ncbi:MAG: bifunctional oligoribonuclease/PAP phosphatase NrnA [Clostridia bacterium]|nr:bifunctional oligoribonuclease/PAP phosphatase NrnA [Clostridia bacterium]